MTDAEVVEWCADAGLRIAGLERRGPLLLLKPAGFEDLPEPASLAELARSLKERLDVKWVSLDLGGAS